MKAVIKQPDRGFFYHIDTPLLPKRHKPDNRHDNVVVLTAVGLLIGIIALMRLVLAY